VVEIHPLISKLIFSDSVGRKANDSLSSKSYKKIVYQEFILFNGKIASTENCC